MNYFVNNREVIKNLAINTGTTSSPEYSALCVTSEVEFTTDFNATDFYVFCDAIQRHLLTGASISLDTTVKLDINNVAIQNILGKIKTLLTGGTVAQFNNVEIKFDLLTGIAENVLTYTTYTASAVLNFSDLGGAAEEEGEFSLNMSINGKATVSA